MKRSFSVLLLALSLLAPSVQAQGLRDPTQPPGMEAAAGAAASGRSSQPSWSVIVVDGRRHLAVGTRLHAEGRARIERITETEIWLREGQALRKVPLYAGVQRRAAPAAQP